MDDPRKKIEHTQRVSVVLGGVIGLVFAAIGLVVIGNLWIGDEFGRPPIFFRLVGSLIALVFVLVGGTIAHRAWAAHKASPEELHRLIQTWRRNDGGQQPPAGNNYTCPRCAAPLAEGAEVSPHGDVKCSHCGAWFNIHGKTA